MSKSGPRKGIFRSAFLRAAAQYIYEKNWLNNICLLLLFRERPSDKQETGDGGFSMNAVAKKAAER